MFILCPHSDPRTPHIRPHRQFEQLNEAILKLTLNDASVSVARETSVALGQGFRCGFLGVLHMEVSLCVIESIR